MNENSAAFVGQTEEQLEWLTSSGLSISVIGASGDLAKKKTYPSLLNLFAEGLLPPQCVIFGYARSKMTDDGLRGRIRPFLLKGKHSKETIEKFLNICRYIGGTR
jgi:glucose-6-phosphate 1-dehydrogenase